MSKKVCLLVHGPFSGNAYSEIFSSLKNSREKNIFEKIVFSVYKDDEEMTKEALLPLMSQTNTNCEIVCSEDVFNPGFFNINRQINLVSKGLENLPDDCAVIKLRNDQWVDFDAVLRNLPRIQRENKILTTNCFSRKDRLYHPSDLLLVGSHENLKIYYDAPKLSNTHFETEYFFKMARLPLSDFQREFVPPEAYLCREYLKRKGWKIENTFKDSDRALKSFFILVNTWNVGLRWKKERNPRLKSGTIILPYTFSVSPFLGAPIEHARCYSEADFTGEQKLKDKYFLLFARVLFLTRPPFRRRLFFYSKRNIQNFSENSLIKKLVFSRTFSSIRKKVKSLMLN